MSFLRAIYEVINPMQNTGTPVIMVRFPFTLTSLQSNATKLEHKVFKRSFSINLRLFTK